MRQKPFTNNGCSLRFCLLLLAALCVTSLAGCQKPPRTPGASIPTAATTSVALPGSDVAADAPHAPSVTESAGGRLTTYDDPETGVRFQYPSAWRPWHDGSPMYLPSFTAAGAGPPRVTQVFTPADPEWNGTNLTGASFAYTERKGFSAQKCSDLMRAAVASESATAETINGVAYRRAEGADAGMCHRVQMTVDVSLHKGVCYIFERDIQSICPGVRNPGEPVEMTSTQRHGIEEALDRIMHSVTIR